MCQILLVDDDPNILSSLARSLRDQPYSILTARSAEEARTILQRWPVGLVVCDEQMPGLSGTEFLAWVARKCPDVVRIVLTGHGTPEMAQRAVNDSQVFRFFTKPCDVVRLAISIREGLEHRKRLLTNC